MTYRISFVTILNQKPCHTLASLADRIRHGRGTSNHPFLSRRKKNEHAKTYQLPSLVPSRENSHIVLIKGCRVCERPFHLFFNTHIRNIHIFISISYLNRRSKSVSQLLVNVFRTTNQNSIHKPQFSWVAYFGTRRGRRVALIDLIHNINESISSDHATDIEGYNHHRTIQSLWL